MADDFTYMVCVMWQVTLQLWCSLKLLYIGKIIMVASLNIVRFSLKFSFITFDRLDVLYKGENKIDYFL